MHRFRLAAVLTLICTVFVTAAPGNALAKTKEWQGELPIRQAWLRDHLPDESLIYMRIPHLFGIFATPKGNALDAALRSEANVTNVMKIRQGLIDNVLPLFPPYSETAFGLMEEYLRSPVEIAAILAPAPTVLVSANLNLDSATAFGEFLSAIGEKGVPAALAAPLDARGVGEIIGLPAPAFVRFDENTGVMLINAGPAATAEGFETLLSTIDSGNAHRMRSMERRVDESGQGFFAWIDSATAMPYLQMLMQPDQYQAMAEMGLDKFSAVGFGWGVAGGKGRVAFVANLPPEQQRGPLPLVRNTLDARSVGDPDGVLLISFPTKEEFLRIETEALADADAEENADWLQAKAKVLEVTGVPLEDFFEALGPEVILILDRAGDYLAVRLQDARLWDSIVERLAKNLGGSVEKKRIKGDTYHHLAFPSDLSLLSAKAVEELQWFGMLYTRLNEHTYWMRDGDFLYLSSIPQPLMDRAAMRPRTDIGEWFAERQRIDASEAIVSISGTTRKLSRRVYSMYIEIVQLLGDLALVDVDIWNMPSPAQLELPEVGTLGLTVNFGSPTVSVELTFENNPGEFLGGLGGIATMGILAAIAIPAYQDYTIRAKVSEGLLLSGETKARISEHYTANGRYPDADAAAELSIDYGAGKYTESVIVEPDTGRITVYYREGEIPGDGQLFLEPVANEQGYIDWSCSTSIAAKHVPAACRD